MSKDYTNEIGYESLLSDFKRYQKQTPRGVGMTRKGKNIYLQFKTPNTDRKPYACNCSFTLDGMVNALRKSKLVKEKLENLTSEVDFWDWYDKEIKNESQLVDDHRTFIQAIIEVKRDFWNRPDRRQQTRDKSNPSHQASWYRTYGCFYKHLPEYKTVNFADIKAVVDMQKKGSRNYKYAVSAMKKLVRVIKQQDILEALEDLNIIQTKHSKLRTVTLDSFMAWRDEVLGKTSVLDSRVNLNNRKAWLWVFSMQIAYGLRINEAFAIKNLFESYVAEDGKPIPALNNPSNATNLIYIGNKTLLGTTVKTGSRIARPNIPPKCFDLIERLDIKTPLQPTNKPNNGNNETIRKFHSVKARKLLTKWNAPFTQTHALRHLANINGIQAGIPQEVRAQSMGHTVQMNESVYKKRQSTQTTIDLLLNSNSNAIDFVTALAEAKKLVDEDESNKQVISRLLSIIYQKDTKAIDELL